MPAPAEIAYSKETRILSVRFDDERTFDLPAELLRVESPSAEVQGHGPGEKTLVSGKRRVKITAIEPVGNYAVRLVFDDGHDSGFYSWDTLYTLGQDRDAIWSDYLDRLAKAGQSRD